MILETQNTNSVILGEFQHQSKPELSDLIEFIDD